MGRYKRIKILGNVPFDKISGQQLVDEIVTRAVRKEKAMILNMNAYGVVTFLENRKYANIIKSADIIYPDGWGPVYASKYLKTPLLERANVGDFIGDLLSEADDHRLRIFLLGSEKILVERTANIIKKRYKKLNISGYHDGYFSVKDKGKMCLQIKKAKPQLVLVGMGLPLQEYFIWDNWDKLPPAVYMGIGGAFNYISETKRRAPVWMRNNGIEWIYRLVQEPVRLWKRYTITNVKFLIYLIKFYFQAKFRNNLP